MAPSEVSRRLHLGQQRGCSEALFLHGQDPGHAPDVREDLARYGCDTMVDYVEWGCGEALRQGVLPHSNVGIVDDEALERLGAVNASMGLMLESSVELAVHRSSPSKDPSRRIRFIEAAGRLRIPFTTGLLIGIGEMAEARRDALRIIADLADTYHHIQEVIVQPVVPSARFPIMPPGAHVMKEVVAQARRILPADVTVQIPANLVDPDALVELLAEGATDLGGISPVTGDDVNPHCSWPTVAALSQHLENCGTALQPRLPLYPGFMSQRWCSGEVWEVARMHLGGAGP